jgi:hypothetical protein
MLYHVIAARKLAAGVPDPESLLFTWCFVDAHDRCEATLLLVTPAAWLDGSSIGWLGILFENQKQALRPLLLEEAFSHCGIFKNCGRRVHVGCL